MDIEDFKNDLKQILIKYNINQLDAASLDASIKIDKDTNEISIYGFYFYENN